MRLCAEVIVNEPSALAGAFTHCCLVLAEVTQEPERADALQVHRPEQRRDDVGQPAQPGQTPSVLMLAT